LLASEDEALLIGRDAFFVLNLGFDVVDGVGGFNLKGDGYSVSVTSPKKGPRREKKGELTLASECLDEDLHVVVVMELVKVLQRQALMDDCG
jgi:hypothetical protein